METTKRIKTAVEKYQQRRTEIKERVRAMVTEIRQSRQADKG